MARETKAQRLERETAQRQAELAQAEATYLDRVITVLERANKVNFELEVKNRQFVLVDRDDRAREPYKLNYRFSEEDDIQLYRAEWAIDTKYVEEARRNQEFLTKQAALAKLSVEERRLLNLN